MASTVVGDQWDRAWIRVGSASPCAQSGHLPSMHLCRAMGIFFIKLGLSGGGGVGGGRGSRNEGLGPRGPLGFEGRASCFPSSLRAEGKETGWKNKERG